ncbi:MAG: hypothetical protein KAW17_03100 [Candidatus Eisenbacteria sp.]|nr:hypothetical protein [Candidatus Eisenbacteria bacterium]
MLDHAFRASGTVRSSHWSLVGALLALAVLVGFCVDGAWARPPTDWEWQDDSGAHRVFKAPQLNDFGQRIHSVGRLAMRISNVGVFGANWISPLAYRRAPYPSGEWPSGSGNDYLWAAGLWVGGVTSDGDTLVTAAVYQGEFFANPLLPDYIREYAEGMPGGVPQEGDCEVGDDDGDGLCDEDFLDGYDNDGDGMIDEDFAAYSQQMFASVYYDTVSWFNDFVTNPEDHHHPLGLRVEQASYAWSQPSVDDFIGIDFKVANIDTGRIIYDAYVGFMVDSDCGPTSFGANIARDDWSDYIEFDTLYTAPGTEPESLHISLAFMWDDPGGDDGGNARGILGVMFLGHKTDPQGEFAPTRVGIHAYRNWSGSGEDPENDGYRYSYLMGNSHTTTTIDTKVPKADDWRFMVSAGPFAEVRPESSITFQVAFVAGQRDPEMTTYRRDSESDKRQFLGTLIDNAIQAQRVYGRTEPHWRTSAPPPPPDTRLTPGDAHVVIEWNSYPETVADPFTGIMDFGGYQVWKNVGWDRTSAQPSPQGWRLIQDISKDMLSTVATGMHGIGEYRYVDTDVHNGFPYWYAISSYDTGEGQFDFLNRPVKMYGSYSQSFELIYPKSGSYRTLDNVRVVPNPFRLRAEWDLAETEFEYSGNRICFQNLPERATVRIYTLSGDLVQVLHHDAFNSESETCWNLITRNDQQMVSGIYLYHVDSSIGTKVGKFAVIR